jgi:RNA polymerase sigma factor (sigma-70 family)
MYSRIEKFYKKNYRQLVNRISGRVGGRINGEDVVQEAFTNALQYKDSYQEGRSIEKWFNTILYNAAHDFQARERGHYHSELHEDQIACDDNPYFKKMLNEIEELIDEQKGKPDKREVLRLYYLKQYAPADINKVVSFTPSNIRVTIHRFKQKLEEIYGKDLYR